jgi:hypothetical protein
MRYVESDNLNVQSSDKSVQLLVVHPHVLSLFAKELSTGSDKCNNYPDQKQITVLLSWWMLLRCGAWQLTHYLQCHHTNNQIPLNRVGNAVSAVTPTDETSSSTRPKLHLLFIFTIVRVRITVNKNGICQCSSQKVHVNANSFLIPVSWRVAESFERFLAMWLLRNSTGVDYFPISKSAPRVIREYGNARAENSHVH